MILLDTSGLLSALDKDQRRHAECAAVFASPEEFVLSPFVLAEAEYMIGRIIGAAAQMAFVGEVANASYKLATMDNLDVDFAREIMSRYRELEIGLTDASIVVLADRYQCWDVLTLDERHFRALRVPGSRRPFRLLPADL